jgi:hypothetical protein
MTYGNVNVDTVTTSTPSGILGAGNASIMKNRIINGSMTIDQRNAGASVAITTAAPFITDRFFSYASQTSKLTGQQNAGSVTPPVGFTNYLGFTSLSIYSVLASDLFVVAQRIEGFNTADLGWGTANAKTVTLSFQVYSSLTGTFGGSLQNSAQNRSYPFTYTISTANTWTTISVTIAGDTTGTWIGATNGIGIQVNFGLGVGSTYTGTSGSWSANNYFSATGATSVVGTSGATFYITGVQLEVGSSATGFEYRQYTTEQQLCYRYYYKWINNTGVPKYGIILQAYATNGAFGKLLDLPVTMRTTPTCTSLGTFNALSALGSVTTAYTSTPVDSATAQTLATANWSGTSGLASGNASVVQITASSYIDASAEL